MRNEALELFNDRLPHKPYFSDDLHFGVRIAGKERAILAKYIQFNQPHAMFWLGFDVDRVGAAIDWVWRRLHDVVHVFAENEYPTGEVAEKLEGSTRWMNDIAEGRAQLPEDGVFDDDGRLKLPERYGGSVPDEPAISSE